MQLYLRLVVYLSKKCLGRLTERSGSDVRLWVERRIIQQPVGSFPARWERLLGGWGKPVT